MTSTSAPLRRSVEAVPGLPGASVPTEPEEHPRSSPRRRRSPFPGAAPPSGAVPAAPVPVRARVRWSGTDGPLREQVRDHATAAGLDLGVDAAAGASVCTVLDGDALLADPSRAAAERSPLLVVTAEQVVPAALWRCALEAGALAVLPLPGGSEELLSRLAALARPRGSSLLLGVTGGCGGAGASSLAARLAAAGRRHGPVVLVDADPLGGGLDLLVEAPAARGIGWEETARLGPDDGEALRDALPRVDEVSLLVAREHGAPDAQDLPRVLAALGPGGGTVVVDLGASLVPAALEHLDRLLVVVPSTDHAVRAAGRRLEAWELPAGLARIAVRRRGGLLPAEVAEDLALPCAASFRDGPRGAVPLLDVRRRGADRAARELLAQLHEEAGS
ncbi:hypothetical protein [Brachybacterium sp. YJGR34]|uniref:hypothetical protein n=1 Tax=Brachybacterium sp. YJGR34 TaxID=2059911 RepID=UPI000E09FF13|nr:hypothetical protein [Brachybacterium sp. YJGR34]